LQYDNYEKSALRTFILHRQKGFHQVLFASIDEKPSALQLRIFQIIIPFLKKSSKFSIKLFICLFRQRKVVFCVFRSYCTAQTSKCVAMSLQERLSESTD